ncbi:MAG: hypothetical protein AB4426_28985 [Xenococcaceae cyanobacterium]
MIEPSIKQLRSQYRQCYVLTNVMFQPIHIIRVDERTMNVFILAGHNESIELQITPEGEVI